MLRHGSITAAFALAVLMTDQALADDSGTPAAGGFHIGSRALLDDDGTDSSGLLWLDLRQPFPDATISIGAALRLNGPSLASDLGNSAYANINVDGFILSGRVARWDATGFSEADEQSFSGGASYELKSSTVGIDWSRIKDDDRFLSVDTDDSGDVVVIALSPVLCLGLNIEGPLDRDRLTRDDCDKSLDYLMNF